MKQNSALADLYRELPSVDELLRSLSADSGAVDAARLSIEKVRSEIAAGKHDFSSLSLRLKALKVPVAGYGLHAVINATGVILHTNLGRAPLSQRALDHVVETARGYCNLELDLVSGKRGRRERIAERLLLSVLKHGASEDLGVFIANNCAAATFLTLNSLASGGEVIVSRGELVEIGGGFRIPEILAKAGAVLREVGTTNKTRIADYQNAVTAQTKLILRVHRSNFRIAGFTERPTLAELMQMGRHYRIPVFEDQGTGALIPLTAFGVKEEPTLIDSLRDRVDLVAASGDKLLGGPQAGLIIGRRELIDIIIGNPLARACRVDKLTYAALEATLLDYASSRENDIPVVRMMRSSADGILCRAQALSEAVTAQALTLTIGRGRSIIGGGTTPGNKLPTYLVRVTHGSQSAQTLLRVLRGSSPPVIARISRDRVLIDLRTVLPDQDASLAMILNTAACS